VRCSPEGEVYCDAEASPPGNEVCDNGVDDDCDGAVDEGCEREVRLVGLTEPGAAAGLSSVERRDEPFELPLVAGGYLDDGVVAYWPLDGDGQDAAGKQVAGVDVGDPASVDGALGADSAGMRFGLADGIRIESTEGLDFGLGDFTLSLWVRHEEVPAEVNGDGAWFYRRADAGFGTSLWYFPEHKGWMSFWLYDRDARDCGAGGRGSDNGTGVPVDDGRWHHVVFVRSEVRKLQAFVDGRLTNVWTMAHDCPIDNDGGPVLISASREGLSNGFLGDLDEIVVLGRAVSALEVKHYYGSRRPWGTPLFPDAQPDFDDLLVTEEDEASGCGELEVPFEVVGARPLAGRAEDLDEHVVGYWPLDDGDFGDLVGIEDAASVELGEPQAALGRFGDEDGAIRLDGEDDGAELWRERGLRFGSAFSIELWLLAPPGAHGTILSTEVADHPRGWFISLSEGNGRLSFQCQGSEVAEVRTRSEAVMADGRWHHVAGVREGNTCRLYVDGLDVSTTTHDGLDDGFDDGHWISVGHSYRTRNQPPLGNNYNFAGVLLDEIVIHDVARSADYLYQRAHPLPRLRFSVSTADRAGESGYPYHTYRVYYGDEEATRSPWHRTDGLLTAARGWVGWWRFDEVSGDTVTDSTAGRHHGTLLAPAVIGEGVSGGGLRMDGTGGGVDVPGLPSFAYDSGYTVETVVRPDDPDGSYQVVVNRGCQWGGCQVQLATEVVDNRLNTFVAADAGVGAAAARVFDSAELQEEAWTHAASSHDGATLSFRTQGVPRGTGVLDWGPFRGLDDDLDIGHRTHPNPRPFRGWIDEVRTMSRVLSPAELLHFPLTSWKLGAPFAGSPPAAGDDDGDGVPTAAECALGLDPTDDAHPPRRWFDGFEHGFDAWEAQLGEECLDAVAWPARSGARSAALDGLGCDNVQLDRPIPDAGPDADPLFAVAAWFHDDGTTNAEIRLMLIGDGMVTLGQDRSKDAARYVLWKDGEPAARGRVVRSPGWHLALLRQATDGRTYGAVDGVPLGSVESVGAGFVRLHVAGTRAHFDDVLVFDPPGDGWIHEDFPRLWDGDGDDDHGAAVTTAEDGTVWVAGATHLGGPGFNFALWKYTPDGQLVDGFPVIRDNDAGDGGEDSEAADDLALDSTGNVWVTGSGTRGAEMGTTDLLLWKFGPDGVLAEGFPRAEREGGRAGFEEGLGIAIGPDDAVWVSGTCQAAGGDLAACLWRYDTRGELADAFPRVLDGPLEDDEAEGEAVAVDPAGNVWLTGYRTNADDEAELALWKLDPHGRLYDDFPVTRHGDAGGDGDVSGHDLAIDSSGHVWVAGEAHRGRRPGDHSDNDDLVVWRFDSDGRLAPGFPRVFHGLSANGTDFAEGIALDAEGHAWVTGLSWRSQGVTDFVLLKLSSDGTLHQGFPVLRTNDAGGEGLSLGTAVTVDPRGRVWATGYSTNDAGDRDLVLWRFD